MSDTQVKDTPDAEVRAAIERVAAKKREWAQLPPAAKLALLRQVQANADACFDAWGEACSRVRGVAALPHMWSLGHFIGPGLLGVALAQWIETYEALAATGAPPAAAAARQLGPHAVVQVAPYTTWDSIVNAGERIELVMQAGKPATQGARYNEALAGAGALVGVLGAGNFEAETDILTKMFGEGKVCVCKTHPNLYASTGPFHKQVLKPLIDAGYVAIVEGNVAPAKVLIEAPEVDELIMTGGQATFDRIMWGDDPAAAKRAGKKAVNKPFEAELGAASPYVVVPSKWTPKELAHQAELLVASKLINSGAVCASPQSIIVDADWPQLAEFQDAVIAKAKEHAELPVFYGGSCAREMSISEGIEKAGGKVEFPTGKPTGDRNEDGSRATVRLGVALNVPTDAPLLSTEAFAPLLGFVPIKANNDPDEFLKQATELCNTKAYGTLSMSLIIHPTVMRDNKKAFEKALVELKYGTIGINEWGGMAAGKGVARWGAYRDAHTDEDIQSGKGEVNNCRLYDHAEKTLFYSDFMSPNHLKLPSAATAKLYYRASALFIKPSVLRLLPVMSAALLGL